MDISPPLSVPSPTITARTRLACIPARSGPLEAPTCQMCFDGPDRAVLQRTRSTRWSRTLRCSAVSPRVRAWERWHGKHNVARLCGACKCDSWFLFRFIPGWRSNRHPSTSCGLEGRNSLLFNQCWQASGKHHYMSFDTAKGLPYWMVSTGWVGQVRMLDRK